MYTVEINNLKQKMVRSGLVHENQFYGYSDEHIQKIMQHQKITTIPLVYVQFLSIMGRSAGGLVRGLNATYPNLLTIKKDAEDLLELDEINGRTLENTVVISMYQGHSFLFLKVNEGNNPPVYRYSKIDLQIEKIVESFLKFITDSIDYWLLRTNYFRQWKSLEIKVHTVGKIVQGNQYKGWYIFIQTYGKNGHFLLLLSNNKFFGRNDDGTLIETSEGYDSWMPDLLSMEYHFIKHDWVIEWMNWKPALLPNETN